MTASSRKPTAFRHTGAAARVREAIDQDGFDGAFVDTGVQGAEIRDARYRALVKRYRGAYKALKKYVDGKAIHNDDTWRGDEHTVSHVAMRYHQEGFDYAFDSYSHFEEVKDKRFHALRRRYLAARTALDNYVSVPTRSTGTGIAASSRYQQLRRENAMLLERAKPKTLWQRLFG